MMKNKIMTVLLLTAAGLGQDAMAMAGAARKFAQSFTRVKHSVAARAESFCLKYPKITEVVKSVPSACGIYTVARAVSEAWLYYQEKAAYEYEKKHALTPIAPEVEKEILASFNKHGLFPKIDDMVDETGVQEFFDGTTKLCIDNLDRCVLAHGTLDVCYGKGSATAEKKHVMALLSGHEVDHLLHHDSSVQGKKNAELLKVIKSVSEDDALPLLHAFCKELRDIEKRADLNAAYNAAGKDAEPEILAQHVEDLICYLRFSDIFVDQRRLKGKKPEDYALLYHPLVPVRVGYLTELAAEFRKKKTMASKVGTFAKQQRAELGKLFRGELPTPVKKIQIDPIKVSFVGAGAMITTKK